MKLEQIVIHWWSVKAQCLVHKPVSTLLHQKSADLRKLEITTSPLDIPKELKGWKPHFPQLEKISYTYQQPGADPSAQKAISQAVIQGARKLTRIYLSNVMALKEVPEEKYGLLTQLDFSYCNAEFKNMFRKIAEKRPALKVLQIDGLKTNPYVYNIDDDTALNRRLLESPQSSCHFPHFRQLCKLPLTILT